MAVYSEADLVLPALEEIGKHSAGITTSDLLTALRRTLRPTGDDLSLLEGRNDDRFSQKVRNLKSHNTLTRDDLATFDDGKYFITSAGAGLVDAGRGVIESLARQGFSEKQRQNAQDKNIADIVIEEGQHQNISTRVARRSRLLRKAALRHFADPVTGSIACAACGFRAENIYGPDGKGLIEIHHLEPLFLSKGLAVRTSIQDALRKVVPLCPSCHRMVHFKSASIMSIEELRQRIEASRAGGRETC